MDSCAHCGEKMGCREKLHVKYMEICFVCTKNKLPECPNCKNAIVNEV